MKKISVKFLLLLVILTTALGLSACSDNDSDDNDGYEQITMQTLDDRDAPEYDYTRANKIPAEMTGYWEKSFEVNGTTRTAKVYISAETPIRSYYTVIAVPDGVNTLEFLWKSGWIATADARGEGLFVLEPGADGWGTYAEESDYVNAAISFYSGNSYFSIYGEHYLVGYGAGAPALEAYAVANPLRVIGQVYLDSEGLPSSYIESYASTEYGGENGTYATIEFPDDFEKLTYAETVLPTWYINPADAAADSIAYWQAANDCETTAQADNTYGQVYPQTDPSERWMTSYMGSISKVAVLDEALSYQKAATSEKIQNFLYYYSRYENVIGYANQLVIRANYEELGIEIGNMVVDGDVREYMIYVPESAATIWGDAAPVLFVWAGNTQTDKVFIDATSWWKVAKEEGIILVLPCEQYNASAISVSHTDNDLFFQQLRDLILNNYDADPTRLYCTGQSAGSMATQGFAIAKPWYFAAAASTSGPNYPNDDDAVQIDGFSGDLTPASHEMIPNFLIYGAGDIAFFSGSPWDDETNNLDYWADYFLTVNELDPGDGSDYTSTGWYDRFYNWTWNKTYEGFDVPVFKLSLNRFRSHNCTHEEMPILWDYLKHFSIETDASDNITRYYSPSGFKIPYDEIPIYP